MKQSYGALRIISVRLPADAAAELQQKYPTGWLPEERLVHVLAQRETDIGRALNNDIVLMDPTVSREHARMALDGNGWRIYNLTEQNVVRVNGRAVPGGGSLVVKPQDILVLGSTMLQLIAPHTQYVPDSDMNGFLATETEQLPTVKLSAEGFVQQGTPRQGRAPTERPTPRDVDQGDDVLVATYEGWEGLEAPQWQEAHSSRTLLPLPPQSEPGLAAQAWDKEESLLGAGVTLQFALPQRMGTRTRWLIAGVGVAILLASVTITIVLNGLLGFAALAQYGMQSVLAALIIPVIPALGIFLLVSFMDRFEKEPWFLRLAAFLWGAIIAIPAALLIEHKIDTGLQNLLQPATSDVIRSALQGLNAGVTEETVKGLGVLLLFFILRDEFDNVTDGIVYGALIGAGFAMIENFRYFAIDFKQFSVFLIMYRIVLGWLGHSTFTVCFGAALGYVRHTRVRWRQIVIPLLGYLVAVGLHSFFDFVDFQASTALNAAHGNSSVTFLSLLAIIGDYIPPFIAQMFLLYILIRALAHEAAVIREFLATEVTDGVVRVEEYALLQNSFQRIKAERRVLRWQGIRQWLRVRALYQTEIGLAFRKWHVSMGDKPKLGYVQPEDAYRRRIKHLRQDMLGAKQKI